MSEPVALANIPITDDPDTFGTEVYSLAVSGGTLILTYTRQPNGQNPSSACAFVANGASSDAAPQAVTATGNTTLTAANLLGGPIFRTGMTAARTDTTDTAAAIQAAWSGGNVNSSRTVTISNQTQYNETLAAGSGVTITGSPIVLANGSASYLMQWTGVNTVTLTRTSASASGGAPNGQYATLNATTGTLPANAIEGARHCTLLSSNATPGAQTTRTAAQMLAAIPGAAVGFTWIARIINSGAGVFTLTADGSVTLTGTATVAQNTWREFLFTITGATTATAQEIGTGTNS